jgi:Tfp pilus assembly protein PilF
LQSIINVGDVQKEVTMKKIICATILVASFVGSTALASSAWANEVFSDNSVSSAVSGVSSEVAENLRDCLQSDTQIASSKAIRACSKAYKASIPIYDVRSDILTRRGFLQLSAGRFDKASRDFKSAAKLNRENEFAYLGEGYTALLEKDYAMAAKLFNDCTSHDKAAPLAIFGLAMTKEMSGDMKGAVESYKQAAKMRPDWQAPRAELARVTSSI